MRELLRGERAGSPGTVAALVGLACLFLFLFVALLSADGRLKAECRDRRTYDASAQHTREVFRMYYLQQIQLETANRHIDDQLRQARVGSTRLLIGALDDTLGKTVNSPCRGLL